MCKILLARVGRLTVCLSAACLAAVALMTGVPQAEATVTSGILDDIWPTDNPFTPQDEGLPNDGNLIDPEKDPNAMAQGDPRTDYGPLPLGYDPDYFESHLDVIVGRTGSASLTIDARSQLRYEDLIIGEMFGSEGSVRIQGEQSLYNNNYLLLPAAIGPDNQFGIVWGESIREPDDVDGFDLYIGQGGEGTMELLAGGRAEIQDAVSIGDLSTAEGYLKVDGAGSLLRNGGAMFATAPMGDEIHQFVLGRLGTGTAQILNAGSIISFAPENATGNDFIGAVIGGAPHDGVQVPEAGGTGYMYVDGLGSSWTVGGDLQVGGFHANHDLMTGDLEGDEIMTPDNAGRGTLTVSNGGLVNIVSPIDPEAGGTTPQELNLLIGRYGTVTMQGGRIEVNGGLEQNTGNPIPFIDDVQVINDGLIQGNGSIETGIFNNRYFGQVKVLAGEKLEVISNTTILPPMHRDPLANWGKIEALGTDTQRAEIIFNRTGTVGTFEEEAFHNRRLTGPPAGAGPMDGLIVAQNATLRFESGLINDGILSFSAGTNVVAGGILNNAPVMPGERGGLIFISGDNTTVLFEDEMVNNGILELAPNISLVTLLRGFTMGGTGALSTSVGGRPTGQEINNLLVAGDVALDGLLDVSLFTAPGVPGFSPQPGDTFQILSSASEMTGDFAFVNLPFVSPTVGLFAFPDYNLDAYFVTALGVNPAFGADLDGSGLVDDLDLSIIRQNLGNPGGLGDINGDGIVDGTDLFIWQIQAGGPGMPFPGSGSGSGAGAGAGAAGTVPEPASLALLGSGGLLALAAARRRRRRLDCI